MRYVFKSKAAADIIMMAPVGDQLLRIVGREPAPRGIIEAAQLPSALSAIERAIAAELDAARQPAPGRAAPQSDDEDSRSGERVGLQQRAWPMLQMMKRSIAEHADIVWGV